MRGSKASHPNFAIQSCAGPVHINHKKNTNKIFGGVIGQYQVTHEEQILKKIKQIYFKNLVIKQSKKNKKPTLNNLGLKSSSPW